VFPQQLGQLETLRLPHLLRFCETPVTSQDFTIKKRDQYVFDLYELIDIYELLKNIDLNGSICENIDLNDFTLI
jgi:hypothetical protein